MPKPAILDHVVINARTDLDRCEAQFRDIGFSLTPRGYHTLGSINALAIFATDYLELLGLPPGKEEARPDLSNAPPGLNGIVFKTANADETHAHLVSLGIDAAAPKSFSRPATLDDGTTHDVKFRTVTVPPDVFPAGRLYFCEHLTPEMVWRPEWQEHGNRAQGFDELVVISEDPEGMSGKVGQILSSPSGASTEHSGFSTVHDGFVLSFQTQEDYSRRFGQLAISPDGRADAIGAAIVKAAMPDALRRNIEEVTDAFEVSALPDGLGIKVGIFNTLLVFRDV